MSNRPGDLAGGLRILWQDEWRKNPAALAAPSPDPPVSMEVDDETPRKKKGPRIPLLELSDFNEFTEAFKASGKLVLDDIQRFRYLLDPVFLTQQLSNAVDHETSSGRCQWLLAPILRQIQLRRVMATQMTWKSIVDSAVQDQDGGTADDPPAIPAILRIP